MRGVRIGSALACCLLVGGLTAEDSSAQEPSTWSVVAGPTFGNISSDDFPDSSSSTGFFFGIGRAQELSERWSVVPYVAYVQKGAEFGTQVASYDYIEVPVLFSASFPVGEDKAFTTSVGPQFGFQIKCDEDGVDCKDFATSALIEAGLMGAVGLSIPTGDGNAFSFGAAADFGLTNLFDDLDYKTRTYYLFVQYSKTIGG